MEDQVPDREEDAICTNGHSETELLDYAPAAEHAATQIDTQSKGLPERHAARANLRVLESPLPLIDCEVMIGFKDVKTAMVLSPNHRWPMEVEGLLVDHRRLPLGAGAEVSVTVGDREVVTERFYLPTPRSNEVIEAHRKLAEVNNEILVDENLRTHAMEVFYPELSDEYDLWYRIAIDEHGQLIYALHVGPSDHQEIKQRIEGSLQL
jgi:hypothetical protein